jgi:hypothetical protein
MAMGWAVRRRLNSITSSIPRRGSRSNSTINSSLIQGGDEQQRSTITVLGLRTIFRF